MLDIPPFLSLISQTGQIAYKRNTPKGLVCLVWSNDCIHSARFQIGVHICMALYAKLRIDNKQVQASILLYYTRFNSSAFCVSKCKPKANDNRKCVRVFYIEKSVYTLTRINPYELMCICNAKVGAGLRFLKTNFTIT